MSVDSTITPVQQGPDTHGVKRRMLQVVVMLVVIAALLFISAGTLAWSWAWLYVAASITLVAINALVLPRDVIVERGQRKENVKPWDRTLTSLITAVTIIMLVVAGLDFRFGWSAAYPAWIHWAALVLLAAGQLLFTWAMTANHYFSTMVRIQSERGHAVATGGPYRYVRHPGYLGTIVANLCTPILLGSLWALIPAVVISALFVLRTALEDLTLQAELPGYREFAQTTRYRLLPFVW